MKPVSVVIPAYEAAGMIAGAVRTAWAQPEVDEVVVVDDGSTDETAAEAAGAEAKVIRTENRGPAAARNRGVAEVRGEWVAFLDADDYWLPGALAGRLAASDETTVGVFGRARFVDMAGRPLGRVPFGRPGRPTFGELLMEDTIPTPGIVLRRRVFEEAGGFDEELTQGADHDYWLRLARRYPGGLLGIAAVDTVCRRRKGQVTRDVARFLLAWEEILAKMERMDAAAVAPYRARAQANARRVASVSAYEGGRGREALGLLWAGIRWAPGWMLADGRTWWQLAAVMSQVVLPAGVQGRLANAMMRMRRVE